MSYQIEVDEEQRQLILMALAHLAVERPGWDDALSRIAVLADNVVEGKPEMYEQFKRLRSESRSRPG